MLGRLFRRNTSVGVVRDRYDEQGLFGDWVEYVRYMLLYMITIKGRGSRLWLHSSDSSVSGLISSQGMMVLAARFSWRPS